MGTSYVSHAYALLGCAACMTVYAAATGRPPCHMHSRQSMQSAIRPRWLCSQRQPTQPTPAWPAAGLAFMPASPHNEALAQRGVVGQLEAPRPANPGEATCLHSAAHLASLKSSHPSQQQQLQLQLQQWLLLSLP